MTATPGDPDGYSEGYEDGYIAGREEAQSPEVQQELARLREQVRLLRTALLGIGADIAKGGCCDHPPGEGDSPNRCLREHLMVKFLAYKRKALTDTEPKQ